MKRRLSDNRPETLVGTDAMKLQALRIKERNLAKRLADIETGKKTATASEAEVMRSELAEVRRVAGILGEIVEDPSKDRRNKNPVSPKVGGFKDAVGKILNTFNTEGTEAARA